jgi:hypothetical protein
MLQYSDLPHGTALLDLDSEEDTITLSASTAELSTPYSIKTRMDTAFATKSLNNITLNEMGIPQLTAAQRSLLQTSLSDAQIAIIKRDYTALCIANTAPSHSRLRVCRPLKYDDILIARSNVITLVNVYPKLAAIPTWYYRMMNWKRRTVAILLSLQ